MVHSYSNNHEITDLHPQIGVRAVVERVTAKKGPKFPVWAWQVRMGLTVREDPFPGCLGQGPDAGSDLGQALRVDVTPQAVPWAEAQGSASGSPAERHAGGEGGPWVLRSRGKAGLASWNPVPPDIHFLPRRAQS